MAIDDVMDAGRLESSRQFRDFEEVFFFTVKDGRIATAWGLEGNDRRRRQLAL